RSVECRGDEVAGGCAMRGHGQGAVRPLASCDRRAAPESIDDGALIAVETDLQVNDLLRANRPFESSGCVQRDDPPVVDDRDAVGELRGHENLLDARLGLARRDVVEGSEVLEVLAPGELHVETPLARKHRAETRADLPWTHERVYAEDADRPARRYEQGGEHLHRRSLSGAVRAEK